ncbi:MAG: winged helix-turn-helix domain-containing protein [Acidobacteriota bacterium]
MSPSKTVRFGLFEFDIESGELRRDGHRVRLQPQPAKLLAILLESAGTVVSRDELQKRLWGTAHVQSDLGINFCIRQIREALAESAESPSYVETIRGEGYRFIAPVSHRSEPEPKFRTRLLVGVTAALTLFALGWYWSAGPRQIEENGGIEPAKRIAVLPFEHLTEEPDMEVLALGLSEELTYQLGALQMEHLAVIARSSADRYDPGRETPLVIGRKLRADLLLTGTVRRVGNDLRITAQLVRTADQTLAWGGTFDGDLASLLEIQGKIRHGVMTALSGIVPAPRPRSSPILTPEAYALQLKGRYHLRKQNAEGLAKAVAHFEQLIESEPDFAEAYVDLARAVMSCPNRSFGGSERVSVLLEKAISLDPQSATANLQLGNFRFFSEWDWKGAKDAFEKAIALNGNLAEAHKGLALFYSSQGQHTLALDSVDRALLLDPISVNLQADLGWFLYRARRYSDARQHCLETLDLEPDDWNARSCLLSVALTENDSAEAWVQIKALLKRAESPPADLAELDALAAVDAQGAVATYRARRLARLEESADATYAISLAQAHAEVGNTDRAIFWLEAAYSQRSGFMPFLAIDPALDSVRADARFQSLLERLELPRHGSLDSEQLASNRSVS